MSEPVRHHRYTFREYVELEERANVRHEFLDGEICAMAGGTPEHAALSMAVGGALLNSLRGSNCRVFSSDLSVRVQATGLATYPDVSVVCGDLARDPESAVTITNPKLVVEVTSDSTESYERGEKLAHYHKIPSLDAVLIVSHRERRLDLWSRGADGAFSSVTALGGASVSIPSIGTTLDVDLLYGDLLKLA